MSIPYLSSKEVNKITNIAIAILGLFVVICILFPGLRLWIFIAWVVLAVIIIIRMRGKR